MKFLFVESFSAPKWGVIKLFNRVINNFYVNSADK